MNTSPEFIELVQTHERAWGSDSYTGRPSLSDMLQSPVVVFWKHGKEERMRATLHDDLKGVQAALSKMVLRINLSPPKRSISRIYAKGRRVCIKGVSVKFAYCDEQ